MNISIPWYPLFDNEFLTYFPKFSTPVARLEISPLWLLWKLTGCENAGAWPPRKWTRPKPPLLPDPPKLSRRSTHRAGKVRLFLINWQPKSGRGISVAWAGHKVASWLCCSVDTLFMFWCPIPWPWQIDLWARCFQWFHWTFSLVLTNKLTLTYFQKPAPQCLCHPVITRYIEYEWSLSSSFWVRQRVPYL